MNNVVKVRQDELLRRFLFLGLWRGLAMERT